MFLIIEKINNSADLTQPEVDKLKMCPQTADKMCLQGILVGNGSQWGTFNDVITLGPITLVTTLGPTCLPGTELMTS